MSRGSERILVARFPDWPLVAAGVDRSLPVVVVAADTVVALSPAARAEGLEEGLRRRAAQARCPGLAVIESDPARETRSWEPAVSAVEALAPGVEVDGPGIIALGTRGPSRYFGGDEALADKVAATVDAVVGHRGTRVGIADGYLAASLAARTRVPHLDVKLVVPPGKSREWLAPLPVAALGLPELTGLLVRLGVVTLGDLAALPAASMLGRFGPTGASAHRLSRGLDEQPLSARTPPVDLAAVSELDPPAERVDTAAFVAKVLAEELHQTLAERGLACTRVIIEAETEHGEHLSRKWRHDGSLTAAAVAERVRWQLDTWLNAQGDGSSGTTGGLTLLRLTPDEVRPDHGRQLRFWGGTATGDNRVARTLARVQGLLGSEEVVTAQLRGGRDPAEQVHLLAWGEVRPPPRGDPVAPPWPGRLPGAAPALLHNPPLGVEVLDGSGRAVEVTGRGAVSAEPVALVVAGGTPGRPRRQEVTAWGGPWPVEERWWDPSGRRRARFQVTLLDGSAHLVVREGGRWWMEATYD